MGNAAQKPQSKFPLGRTPHVFRMTLIRNSCCEGTGPSVNGVLTLQGRCAPPWTEGNLEQEIKKQMS